MVARLLLPTVLLVLCPVVFSSGHMNIYVKSSFALNASIEIAEDIYFPKERRVFNFTTLPNQKWFLRNVPVTFGKSGMVWIHSGKINRFGITDLVMKSERWSTHKMTINEKQLCLPFTGFKIEIECDKYWHGVDCDNFCNDRTAILFGKRCNRLGRLGCPKGFRGSNCDQLISYDDPSCGCQNGGTCVSSFESLDKHDTLICECADGFEGDRCEEESYNYADELYGTVHTTLDHFQTSKHFSKFCGVDNEFYL